MSQKFYIFYTVLVYLDMFANADGPVLQTNIGEFEGKLLEFDGVQQKVDAFYGLPFAKKPIRFEKPEPPEPVEERRSATEHKLACSQISFRTSGQLEASEDCLYLNLFRPHQKSLDNKGYPLLFFIHGGAYYSGSALYHSLDYISEHYVTQGVVYIAVQYRLGVFGLASNGDADFPGNYALWDVRQALVWVRENAKYLDIDPERITLWGYSAGASIASHLSLSEQSRDLFSQVIQMSGGGFNEWSLSERTVSTTHLMAKIIGCNQQDSKDLKECLRSFDDESILNAVKQIPNLGIAIMDNKFAPHFDHDFFSAIPWFLLKTAPPKPTLSTMLENEALVFVAYDNFRTSHYIPASERENFGYNDVERILKDDWFTEERFGENATEVLDKVLDFYLHRHQTPFKDRKFHLCEYSRFVGDQTLAIAQMRELIAKVEHGWPVYNLLNVHRENLERTYPDAIAHETVHGSDLPYLLGFPILGDLNFTETDKRYRDRLVGAILQFAKTGNPNVEDKNNFVKATRENPFAYTALSYESNIMDELFKETVQFWEGIVDQYGYDIFYPMNKRQQKGGRVRLNEEL